MVPQQPNGSVALAVGALEAGVQFVTGYPGSPSTAAFDAIVQLADGQVRIEWAINEKSAFDAAFGASLAGVRSLVCLKSVGLNVALDSLMVSNLSAGDGGFVILAGDDPGGWGSQNEEDSRLLAVAAEVPLLEPVDASEARNVMRQAFGLSERFRVPVVVRITRALSLAPAQVPDEPLAVRLQPPAYHKRQPERFNVLPVRVVELHQKLQSTMDDVRTRFDNDVLNTEEGAGPHGIIVAGFMSHKLAMVLDQCGQPPLRILHLTTLSPLPMQRLTAFLSKVESVLIIEEGLPYVEIQIQALAQRTGRMLPVYGRTTGHLPGAGELFAPHLTRALSSLLPDWPWPVFDEAKRSMPSRKPLCDDCPYIPALESLLGVIDQFGGRDAFVITGETGCMVRAQLPPWEIMDLKYGMGSSIGLAAGLARTGISQRIIALSGDSAFLHSGLLELIDAAQAGLSLLVVLLANETTALSGGQPHPATAHDTQGQPRKPLDLASLIHAAGVDWVREVDPNDQQATRDAFSDGLDSEKVAVVIVRRACPRING